MDININENQFNEMNGGGFTTSNEGPSGGEVGTSGGEINDLVGARIPDVNLSDESDDDEYFMARDTFWVEKCVTWSQALVVPIRRGQLTPKVKSQVDKGIAAAKARSDKRRVEKARNDEIVNRRRYWSALVKGDSRD